MYAIHNSKSQAPLLTGLSHLGQYVAAAGLFYHLAPFYAKDDWNTLEWATLDMYAQCLRHLERNEEYVRIAFMILDTSARQTRLRLAQQISLRMYPRGRETPDKKPRNADVARYLDDALQISKSIEHQIVMPMSKYFDKIDIDPFIRHNDSNDGFRLRLRFVSLMPGSFLAHDIRAKLVSAEADQRLEIVLSCRESQPTYLGMYRIFIKCRTDSTD